MIISVNVKQHEYPGFKSDPVFEQIPIWRLHGTWKQRVSDRQVCLDFRLQRSVATKDV